jgi:hypothetical protein
MTSDRDREVTFLTGAVATETLVGIDDQAIATSGHSRHSFVSIE